MCPSWEPAIAQVMQQHGGRNHIQAQEAPALAPKPPERATGVSVRVIVPAAPWSADQTAVDWD